MFNIRKNFADIDRGLKSGTSTMVLFEDLSDIAAQAQEHNGGILPENTRRTVEEYAVKVSEREIKRK